MLPHAPGVQMQDIAGDTVQEDSGDEDEEEPDKRISSKNRMHSWGLLQGTLQIGMFKCDPDLWLCAVRTHDKRIVREEEFSDSEDEGEGGRRNTTSFKKAKRPEAEGEKEGEEKEKKGEEVKGIYSFLPFSSHTTIF